VVLGAGLSDGVILAGLGSDGELHNLRGAAHLGSLLGHFT
jgi:hypothetical protein